MELGAGGMGNVCLAPITNTLHSLHGGNWFLLMTLLSHLVTQTFRGSIAQYELSGGESDVLNQQLLTIRSPVTDTFPVASEIKEGVVNMLRQYNPLSSLYKCLTCLTLTLIRC